MSQYTWSAFSLDAAVGGSMIGIRNTLDDTDILMTGRAEIIYDNLQYRYRVSLCGKTCYFDTGGLIVNCPEDSSLVNTQLMLVKVVLDQTTTNVITRSSGGTEVNKTISSANPRDEFAMEVLNAIIQKQDNPQGFDDGSMLRTAQQAYRWANAMMEAAADNRYDDTQAPTQGGSTGDVANAINSKGTSATPLVVKGNSTYTPSGGTAIPDVLNVNVVAGGGGGGSTNVNLDDLINGLGYDKNATPVANATQAGKMDELVAAVTAAGKIKKADVSNVGDTQAAIDSVSDILVFSDFNTIVPYKVTPLQLANRMARYDGLVERTVPSFPSALLLLMGSYYKLSVSTSDVAINLPALSSDGMAKIVIFRFTCTAATGGTTASFSVTVSGGGAKKGRGSAIPLALTPGTYEVDCVDNGSEWIVGVTEIVS